MSKTKSGNTRKGTLFGKMLAGHVFLTLFVLILIGSLFLMLMRMYITRTNLDDLTGKTATVAQMLSRPDGRIRLLTQKGLFELEAMCDAQILYVDSNMVARRMATRKVRRQGEHEDANGSASSGGQSNSSGADETSPSDGDEAGEADSRSQSDASSEADEGNSNIAPPSQSEEYEDFALFDGVPDAFPPPESDLFVSDDMPPAISSELLPDLAESEESSSPQEEAADGEAIGGGQTNIPRADDVLRILNRYRGVEYPQIAQDSEQLEEDAEEERIPLERVDLSGTLDEELLRSIMAGEVATDIRRIHFIDSLVMFAGMPIIDTSSGETVAAIILCRSVGEIDEMSTRIIDVILWAGAATLLCAVLIALFLSRKLTRPIQRMSLVAERMSQGHYGERCAVNATGEIGKLGSTLDILSQRLLDVIGNLKAEKSKLEKVLSAIGEGIIAIDEDESVIHHNAAALNILGIQSWDDPSSDPDVAKLKETIHDMLSRAAKTGGNISTQWTTITSRAIEAVASPITDGEGDTMGAVCLIRDVTEAQKTEQMRRDFIANISHELRTPLTGIRGMVEPLLDGLMQTDKERMDCYNIIFQETIRLEKLISEMLDLSRLQSGRATIELEPMPPDELLMAVKRRMDEHASKAGVSLLLETDNVTDYVMGNEDRIIQVLIIFIDNALSFTPSGGKVTLFAKDAGDCVEIGVSDTGCGIDPIDLPYIWERFYKADRSRMRTSGTGLGLAIAKMVVELMGGSIDVKTRVGYGSTFYFSLKKGYV
ncbi:MAG: ATP-binding protein [Clostridia bacterium]|nr:ATP-binding protein [Clostridia bacterium]